ncbi:MAG TPA: alpha/beta hydrolase [Gammaproteobacteria bacterium]|nr:alpha/beta hydrolase [Gammaproteobacteria bacterium]
MKVVLLPGLDGTGILFKPLTDALSKDIDTMVISYPPDLNMSYRELVEFVMGQLPKEEFILVGESFSGPIAYQIALLKPKTIKSVIFVATFLENPRRYFLNLSRLLPKNFILTMPIPDFIVRYFILGSAVDRQVINLYKQTIKKRSPSVLSFRLNEISKLSASKEPCDLRAIYIQATNDLLVPGSCVEVFKKVFKRLNVFRVRGSHFILQTNPIACAEIIENEIRFITEQST